MLKLIKSDPEKINTTINYVEGLPIYIKKDGKYYGVVDETKRKPLKDGTLPLTDEEKKELKKLINIAEDEFFERADLVKDYIQIWWRTKHYSWRYDELRSIKAIDYLLQRFELVKEI